MYEKVEECPSCKHPKFSNYKICTDFSVSTESFALVICDNCQLIFTNPRPDRVRIGTYYDSDNYISHTNKSTNLINFLYKQVRRITLQQKINLIRRHTQGEKLFDYGCGTGTFLDYCKSRNFAVQGYEPNVGAARQASQLLDMQIYNNRNDLKESEKYDIITAWHVIEHVHDLKDTVKLLRKKLLPGGLLFIAVPNINSYDAKLYDEHWAAYDVPRHLYHFSQDSFKLLAKKCKLKVKAIHPLKFDSYYVSLLSEKYKTGKTNFVQALKNGYKSNKLATKTGEYSSLIYVLAP